MPLGLCSGFWIVADLRWQIGMEAPSLFLGACADRFLINYLFIGIAACTRPAGSTAIRGWKAADECSGRCLLIHSARSQEEAFVKKEGGH